MKKNTSNKHKHGMSFELAREIFNDPNIISWLDKRKDYQEERWINLGCIANSLIATVIHTVRGTHYDKEIIRIISARKANRKERKKYTEIINKITQ